MADLVSVAEMLDWLADPTASQAVLTPLLDELEARLEAECARQNRPFQLAQTAREEARDGTGSPHLWLDYPIANLKKVIIGLDPANPSLSLDITAGTTVETAGYRKTLVKDGVRVLVYQVGGTKLTRIDGGRFGCLGRPGEVAVTYDTGDDLPADAALAIKVEAARIYRLRGSEDDTAERTGGWSGDLAHEASPEWQRAVGRHRVLVVA